MIVDSSAIVAILNDEDERVELEELIARNDCRMSAISYFEASIVLMRRRGAALGKKLDAWLRETSIEIVPFDARQASVARDAYARFGKGHHPAGLNFGDCAAYALASEEEDRLLFVGDEFARTDVRRS